MIQKTEKKYGNKVENGEHKNHGKTEFLLLKSNIPKVKCKIPELELDRIIILHKFEIHSKVSHLCTHATTYIPVKCHPINNMRT